MAVRRFAGIIALSIVVFVAVIAIQRTPLNSVFAAPTAPLPQASSSQNPQNGFLPPAYEAQPAQLLARIQALEKQLSADEKKIANLDAAVEKLKRHTHAYEYSASPIPQGWLTLSHFNESSPGLLEKDCAFRSPYCDHAGTWEIPTYANKPSYPKWNLVHTTTGYPEYPQQ